MTQDLNCTFCKIMIEKSPDIFGENEMSLFFYHLKITL